MDTNRGHRSNAILPKACTQDAVNLAELTPTIFMHLKHNQHANYLLRKNGSTTRTKQEAFPLILPVLVSSPTSDSRGASQHDAGRDCNALTATLMSD